MPFHDIPLELCTSCGGMLIEQRQLVRLLLALEQDMGKELDPTQPVVPVPDAPGDAACPRCGRRCDSYGYMEQRLVIIDRCAPCGLIWLDSEELAVVTLMHARSVCGMKERFVRHRDRLRAGQRRLGRMMLNQAIMNRAMGG